MDGREVTFTIPCTECGYRTNVTVEIDWGGAILSGAESTHDFTCMQCGKTFTVPKASLTEHTNRFV